MTIFGLMLIIIFIVLFVRRMNYTEKYVYIMAFLLGIGIIVQIGYLIKLGSFDISYGFAMEIIASLFSLIWLLSRKVIALRRNMIAMLGVIICITIGLIGLIIVPYHIPIVTRTISWDDIVLGYARKKTVCFSMFNVQELLKYVLFFIICIAIGELDYMKKKAMILKIAKMCKAYIVYCIFEFIIKNFLRSDILYTFQQFFFGVVGATQNDLRRRGFFYSLQGFTKEPSHYAPQLMLIIVLFVLQQKISRKSNKIWIYVTVLLITLSMSFSTIICIATLGLLYLVYTKNKRKFRMKNIYILFIAISAIISFPVWFSMFKQSYVGERLINLLDDIPLIISGTWKYHGNMEVSNRARAVSIWETIVIIMNRPLFGLGIGSVSSHSNILSFLADNGVLAFMFWIFAVPFGEKRKSLKYKKAVFIWFFPSLVSVSESIFWTCSGLVAMMLVLPMLFNEKKSTQSFNSL